jgi:DNA-directed RNA polymerase specialized sigma24 family protein
LGKVSSSPRYRELIEKRYFEELSYEEIAEE